MAVGINYRFSLSWEVHIEKLNEINKTVCYTLRIMHQYPNENGLKKFIIQYGRIYNISFQE